MSLRGGIVRGVAALLVLLLVGLTGRAVRGQDKFSRERYPQMDCAMPLDTPLALSGSFGEVRSRHFHGGTDFRTNSEEGHAIYAVERGAVMRISVASSGYGKTLYVMHPNGVTSVYAHLQRFNSEIESWVRAQQYRHKSFEVQLFPPPGRFNVQRGDTIAFSGNTGSSGGPHLHFELRMQNGSVPYNSYLSGIRHEDVTQPDFTRFYVYEIDAVNYEESLARRKRYYLSGQGGDYRLRTDTLHVGPFVGFGVEVRDRVNARSLMCSINELKMRVNGELVYYFNMQQVNFNETAYSDAHVDRNLYALGGHRVMLLFTLPGNELSRYQTERGGYLSLGRGESAQVEIEAVDMAGNRSYLRFAAQGTGQPVRYAMDSALTVLPWRTGGLVMRKHYRLELPPKALYYDVALREEVRDTLRGDGVATVAFGNWYVPLHRASALWLDGSKVPMRHRAKSYLAWVDTKGRARYAGNVRWEQNWAVGSIRGFSTYTVRVDSVAPTISSSSLAQICGRDLSKLRALHVKVSDGQTKIKRVDAYVDGRWVVFEWEPKLAQGTYWFDERCDASGALHRLKIVAEDAVGNVREHECSFYR